MMPIIFNIPLKITLVLALYLVTLVIIPPASAENNSILSPTWKYKDVPEHYIPPEYFKDAKPATPLSESEMINIIISGRTFERFAGVKQPGILAVPVSYLDFSANFTHSTSSPTWHYEKNLAPYEPVAMIRMPGTMYARLLSMSDGKNLELPVSAYVRQYDNLTDLHAHIEPDGMYLQASVMGNDDTGTKPSPTVPIVIMTTPRIHPTPGTLPAPFPLVSAIIAIGCIGIIAAVQRKTRR
ncbi:MAG TPA: hypothetical protein P5013_07260 [Methanoregula sp.]|nr:hypothetical protein [Methanoregula sp.]